ncbi:MAG: HAMP domain-containing protein [Firmicutes bacterium]|nr:HAMP domain-containing protein [Bacillota bacterium]
MSKKTKSRSIKVKLLALIFFGMLVMMGALLVSYIYSMNQVRETSKSFFSKVIYDEVKDRMKFIVQSTISSIQGKYQGETIEREDIPNLLRSDLGHIRYGKNGYCFVFLYDGTHIIAPDNKTNEGKNLLNFKDPTGKKPVQEFISIAKAGGGFATYAWLNPNTKKYEPKMSFIAPLKIGGLEVAIGTGEYVSDIELAQKKIGLIFEQNRGKIIPLTLSIWGLAVFVFLMLIYIYVSRRVSRPINAVVKNIKQIAAGDFTGLIKVKSNDEIGEMARELSKMGESLAEIITQVLYSAAQVEETAEEIAKGNQDLSRRTQEQAATLEEVAATVEEVNSSIQLTTSNSEQANQLSLSTLEAVNAGKDSVQETLTAMEQISTSSQKIEDIIKVVNDIAFQTNLLALNAAVEAARAGDHGRGFAVVATEVRNLAGRTSELSKEVESLIKESAERVGRGNSLVRQSAELLNQIVENTNKTVMEITNVAATMREQATAGEQIQVSIDQLNQVTQQNAAMVEEMAASSMMLSSESGNLNRIVNRFQVSQKIPTTNTGKVRVLPEEATVLEPKPAPDVQKDFVGDSWEKF